MLVQDPPIFFKCYEKIICGELGYDDLSPSRTARGVKNDQRVVLWFFRFNSKTIDIFVKMYRIFIIALITFYK